MDAALSTLRWLVDELNPQDSHGLRRPLMALLPERGDYAEAVSRAERYPDDVPEMQCQSALALHLTGQEAQAIARLRTLVADWPGVGTEAAGAKAAEAAPGWRLRRCCGQ